MKNENIREISISKIDRILKKIPDLEKAKSNEERLEQRLTIEEMLLDLSSSLKTDFVYIQDAIIQSYEERFRESNPDYCDEKIEHIGILSYKEAYAYLTEMDADGLKIVAEKMERSVSELMEIRQKMLAKPALYEN